MISGNDRVYAAWLARSFKRFYCGAPQYLSPRTCKWYGPIYQIRWYHRLLDWFKDLYSFLSIKKVTVNCTLASAAPYQNFTDASHAVTICVVPDGIVIDLELMGTIFSEFNRTGKTVPAERVRELAKV
jgi:hypothetical protein